MKVFVYYDGQGEDASIYLVFAKDRQQADKKFKEDAGVKEADMGYVSCTEYGSPNKVGSFVIRP